MGTISIPLGFSSGTFTPSVAIDEGTYIITAMQTDAAGNDSGLSPAMAPNLVIDKTKPTVTNVDSDGKTFYVADMPTKTIRVSFIEDVSTPAISVNPPINSQFVYDCSDSDQKTYCFDYSIPPNTFVTHTILISDAADAAGNIQNPNNTHTFNINTIVCYVDADKDGYGSNVTVTPPDGTCDIADSESSNNNDCNDTNAAINPAATEVCDGVDNDCDGSTDEGCTPNNTLAGFGSVNTYAEITDDGTFDITGPISLEAWIYPTQWQYPHQGQIISKIQESSQSGYFLAVGNDGGSEGHIKFVYGDGSNLKVLTTSTPPLSLNTWQHIAAVSTGTKMSIYVNGVLKKEENISGSIATNNRPLGIGRANEAPDRYFVGKIDEVRIWNTALSAATITAWYQNTIAFCHPNYSSLAGYYECDDFTPATTLQATVGTNGIVSNVYYMPANNATFTGPKPPTVEVCDGVDNDCDGTIDEGVTTTYYLDADGDGYGLASSPIQACSLPSGYAAVSGDCDDGNSSIKPGAIEVCDGVDNDCDGNINEQLTITSAQTGNWTATSTWVGGVVPAEIDNVIIAAGHTVTADVPVTRSSCSTTTVNAVGNLATNATFTNSGTMTIDGYFQINQGGWATGNAFIYRPGSRLIFENTSGPYDVNGDAYWPSVNVPTNVFVNGAGGITMNVSRSIQGRFLDFFRCTKCQ
ncbi:MAG: hypothetical protein IPH57_06610 [Saprospiraceae bacterium]|nr:hypothetical protein [Saprospiraceae bacterium]